MAVRTLSIDSAGLVLVHQPASRYPIARHAAPEPASGHLFDQFARWWRQAGHADLARQEERRLRDARLLNHSYRWITR